MSTSKMRENRLHECAKTFFSEIMSLFNRRSPYELDERNAWEDHNGDELQKEFRFADEILGHIPRTELLARNA